MLFLIQGFKIFLALFLRIYDTVIINFLKSIDMYFVASIIPLLILGPFLPDLIVSLSSIIFLVYVFKKKLFNYFNKKPLIIFFIFCAYCVILSIFVAENTFMSFESSLFYFRIGVFSCVIWYLIEKEKKFLQIFYYTLIICFSILLVDGYIQFFFGHNTIGLPIQEVRVSSFFGDELIMGSYLARLYPIIFALFLIKKKQKYENYFMSFFFILIGSLVYISGERASFFLFLLSLLFMFILIKTYNTKFKLFLFLGIFILLIIINFNKNDLFTRMLKNPLETTGIINGNQKKIFSEAHDSLIRTAFNMFLDKPLTGHGPKMFRVLCKNKKYAEGKTPCLTHPHNSYIQLLAETGVIGFLFLFSLLCYVLQISIKQLRSIILKKQEYISDYQVCLLAGILIIVWPITSTGNFFNNWLSICYSLPIGFYLHSLYGGNRKNLSF